MTSTREAVLAAAQRLFAERGYPNVHISQIASEAGVSPAMVMKVGVSKQKLFEDATPAETEPIGHDWPRDTIGRELVRRLLERRDAGAMEPLLHRLLATIDAPDPASAREDFERRYITRIRPFLKQGPKPRQRAEMITAMLTGLAYVVRGLRLLDDPRDAHAIIEHYGGMIQTIIDCDSL